MELDYNSAVDEFLRSRVGYLQLNIGNDSPSYKNDLNNYMEALHALELPREQSNDLEDGAMNVAADSMKYAYQGGFQDGIKFILQTLKSEQGGLSNG